MEEYEVGIFVSETEIQRLTGHLGVDKAILKVTREFVKDVAEATDGKVYFKHDFYDGEYYITGYDSELVNIITDYVKEQVYSYLRDNGEFRVKGRRIFLDDLVISYLPKDDSDKVRKKLEEWRNKIEEWKKREEEKQRMRERITEVCMEKGLDYRFYGDHALIMVKLHNKVLKEIIIPYSEEGIERVRRLDKTTVLESYIQKLEEEIGELRRELAKKKEEILRELWEKGEAVTITVKREEQIPVRVVEEDEESW